MYKLLIKPYGTDIFLEADFGDDKPAMTFGVNDIGELKTRDSDYSQRLKLPKTPNNITLFQFMSCYQVTTNFPYRRHDCRLYRNGAELAGKGSYLIVLRENKYFEVCILSGIAELFANLAEIDFATWTGLGECRLPIQDRHTQTEGLCYTFSDYFVGAGKKTSDKQDGVYIYDLPLVRLFNNSGGTTSGLLPALLRDAGGYSFVTNIPYSEFNDKYFSLVDRRANNDGQIICSLDAHSTPEYNGASPVFATSINDFYGPSQFSGFIFTTDFKINGSATRKIVTLRVKNRKNQIRLFYAADESYCTINGVLIYENEWIFQDEFAILEKTFEEGVELQIGKKLSFRIEAISSGYKYKESTSDSRIEYGLMFDVCDIVVQYYDKGGNNHAIPGSSIPLSANLGFKNGKEAFQTIVQLYGLTLRVDSLKKIVYAYTMQKLYDNKLNAKDWSDKINMGSEENTFNAIGYAQTNSIFFKENKVTGFIDRGSFDVSNHTINTNKDLFSINVTSGKGRTIDFFELDDGEINFVKINAPHFVATANLSIDHPSAQSMINLYYAKLIKMLSNCRYVNAEFLLDEIDVSYFDHFTPIYLSQYGRFFYVNQIKNFGGKNLTEVELVKL